MMQQRWIMRGAGGLALLGVFSLGALASSGAVPLATGAQAQPTPTVASAPDSASVQELAERLLAPPYPGPDGQLPTIQLLPGRLPDSLPLQVPIPDGGRLVGSVVRGGQPKGGGTEMVLDAPGGAAETLRFYQQALGGQGWTQAPFGPGEPRGFQPTVASTGAAFCQGAQGPWLSLNVVSRPNAPSDVRLRLDAMNPGPCAQPPGPPEKRLPPGMDRLPALYAPEGVALQMAGSGGGPGRFSSEATAETSLGVAALEAHFAQQLQAAGWTRREGAAQGPLAWSVWTVPGEGDWQGFLYALAGPGADRRALHVEVASATAQPGPYGYPVPAMPAMAPPPPKPMVRPSGATPAAVPPAPTPTPAPAGPRP